MYGYGPVNVSHLKKLLYWAGPSIRQKMRFCIYLRGNVLEMLVEQNRLEAKLIRLDRVNCADSAFIIFELLYNCFKNMPHVFFCHFVVCSVFVYL